MKRIVLSAICTATVEESWTFDVPDNFDTTGTPEEVYDRAMGITDADGVWVNPSDQKSPPGVKFAGVENVEVNDERDREWRAFGVTDLAGMPCAMEFDGHDVNGDEWNRCTTHDKLVLGNIYICEGYRAPEYVEKKD